MRESKRFEPRFRGPICKTCGGRGSVPDGKPGNRKTCPDCGGRGTIDKAAGAAPATKAGGK